MADSFINKLEESSAVKLTDYTVFDIVNNDSGQYFTKKVTLKTLSENLTGSIVATVQDNIDALQAALNTVSTEISNKLDKRGYEYNSPNNKMTGTLLVNAQLSVNNVSHFSNNLNIHNNKIVSLNDPTDDFDGVNKRYVDQKFGSITIPNTSNFLVKSGDAMTGGNLTLFNEPTTNKHATTKYYVDTTLSAVSASILSRTSLSDYIPLSGGIMTGGFITAASDYPTQDRHLSTKKYVDDNYVPWTKSTKVVSSPVYFAIDPATQTDGRIAATKSYVDSKFSSIPIPNITDYIPLSGGTMTGGFITASSDYPTQNRHLSTKKYVDDNYIPLIGNKTITGALYFNSDYTTGNTNGNVFSTKTYVDSKFNTLGSNYLPLSGGTLTGSVNIKGFSEAIITVSSATTTILDLALGNTFQINLGTNITAFTFNNVPPQTFTITLIIVQSGIFYINPWTINGVAVKWENGNRPTITTGANSIDIIAFTKIGSNWFGFNGGQKFL